MAVSKSLGLGTVFTGTVDKKFDDAIKKLKSVALELSKLQTQAKKASLNKDYLSDDALSDFGKAATKATGESKKFQEALAQLAPVAKAAHAPLTELAKKTTLVNQGIQRFSLFMDANNKDGKAWAANVDRNALLQGVLSGKIATTSTGFKALSGDGAKLLTSLNATGQGFSFLGRQISGAHGGMQRYLAALKVTAAYGLAATAIFGVVGALRAGLNEIIQFDQALQNLKAILGNVTETQIMALGTTIQDVAMKTMFSTSEIAKGMINIGQAGFTASESIEAMKAVATLATGTLSELEVTSDLLTTTIRAFHLEATQSSRVADVMAAAINDSKLTVDKLRVAFNYVGTSAAEAGLSVEDTAASMMILANSGLRASTIGTGLRRVIQAMVAPSDRLRETFESHGVNLSKLNPQTAGWTESLKALAKVLWDTKKNTVDMAKAYELFKLQGAQAAAILARGFVSGNWKKMRDAVDDFGIASEMAAKQALGLDVRLKNLSDTAKVLFQNVGEYGLKQALGELIDGLRWVVDVGLDVTRDVFGGMIIQTGLVIVGIVSLTLVFKGLAAVLGLLKLSLASFVNPLTLIVVGISAVAIAMYRWNTRIEASVKALREQAIEQNRATVGLRVYEEAVKKLQENKAKGVDTERDHLTLIKRIKEEYPEIAKRVNLLTLSYEGLIKVIRQHRVVSALGEIRKQFDIVGVQGTRLDELRQPIRDLEEAKTAGGPIPISTAVAAGQLAGTKEYINLTKDYDRSVKDLVTTLVELAAAGDLPAKNIENMILMLGGGTAIVERFREEFRLYQKQVSDFGEEMDPIVSKLTDRMKALHDSLDWDDRLDFLEAYRSHLNRLAQDDKTGKNIGYTIQEREKIRAAREDKFFETWTEKSHKRLQGGLDSEQKYAALRENLVTEQTAKIEADYKHNLAVIESTFNKEVGAAKGNTEKIAIANKNKNETLVLAEEKKTVAIEKLRDQDRRDEIAGELSHARILATMMTNETAQIEADHKKREAIIESDYVKSMITMKGRKGEPGFDEVAETKKIEDSKSRLIALAETKRVDESEKLNIKINAAKMASEMGFFNTFARLTTNETAKIYAQYDKETNGIEQTYLKSKARITALSGDNIVELDRLEKAKNVLLIEAEKKRDDELEKLRDKTEAKETADELSFSKLLTNMTTDETEHIKAQYDERLLANENYYNKVKASIVARRGEPGFDEEMEMGVLGGQRKTLDTEAGNKRNYELVKLATVKADKLLDIKDAENRTIMLAEQRGIKETEETKNQAAIREAQIEVSNANNRAVLRYEEWQAAVKALGAEDKETLALRQQHADSVVAIEVAMNKEVDAIRADSLATFKKNFKDMDDLYRRGEVTLKEYTDAINRAVLENIITAEEGKTDKIVAEGTIFDQIERGIELNKKSIKSWGEFWVEFGTTVTDQIGSGITNAFFQFIDNTKTAKEAVADFARSTMRWLSEVIAKQAIMSALGLGKEGGGFSWVKTILGGVSLAAGGAGLGTVAATPTAVSGLAGMGGIFSYHQGGKVGAFIPRYHEGIASVGMAKDERLSILQTGETVLPRGVEAQQKTVNVVFDNIHIHAVDAASFTQLVQRNPKAITGMFVEAITRGDMAVIGKIREVV